MNAKVIWSQVTVTIRLLVLCLHSRINQAELSSWSSTDYTNVERWKADTHKTLNLLALNCRRTNCFVQIKYTEKKKLEFRSLEFLKKRIFKKTYKIMFFGSVPTQVCQKFHWHKNALYPNSFSLMLRIKKEKDLQFDNGN